MSTLRLFPLSVRAFSIVGVFGLLACSSDAGLGPLEPSVASLSASVGNVGARKATENVDLPFRGTVKSVEKTPFSDPGTVISTDIGTGVATHLGAFAWYSEFVIDGPFGTGTATLTAANGDQLLATVHAVGTLAEGGFDIVETNTITGGTGRFAGASGTFTLERFVSGVTFRTTGTFAGTIRLAK
jgi:hypothetical protein